MMSRLLARELQIKEDELTLSFVKNPTRSALLLQSPWYDVQTQFYTTLHQENFLNRWQKLQSLVKFSEYGKSISGTMMAHLGDYDPVAEGRFYLRWSDITLKHNGKARHFNVPYFLMSQNIQDLVTLEEHTPYSELIPAKILPVFNTQTAKLSRLQKQELAEKRELNRRIYLRAVANGAKTFGSILYLSGVMNRHNTEKKVSSFTEENCSGCTQKEKSDIQRGALNYLDSMKKVVSTSRTEEVITNFCSSLRANHYHWNIDRLKPLPQELLLNQAKLVDYYVHYKLKEKNREAMAKTILEQDLGVLFLTGAINILDKNNEPVGTRLQCTRTSKKNDSDLLVKAIHEAEKNIETYLNRISGKVKGASFHLQETTKVLEYFVQTNQAATIEATSSFPQGIGWVLKSIAELDGDKKRREKMDSVITWGGAVIGIGLTLTGIGAPEGVAILLSTAGLLKGVSSGSYYLIRSKQEKSFAKAMHLVKKGGFTLSEANLREHYKKYKSLKVSYIKEFAATTFSFVNMHREALNYTNGDIKKTHTIMERVLKTMKETGKDEAIGKVKEKIIELAVNS